MLYVETKLCGQIHRLSEYLNWLDVSKDRNVLLSEKAFNRKGSRTKTTKKANETIFQLNDWVKVRQRKMSLTLEIRIKIPFVVSRY